MGFTNSTPNLHLPQYAANDKPSYLTDFNNAMLAIDQGYAGIKSTAESAGTEAGTASTSVQAMQSQLSSLQNSLSAIQAELNSLSSSFSDKSNLVRMPINLSSPTGITPSGCYVVKNGYTASLELNFNIVSGTVLTPVSNSVEIGTFEDAPFSFQFINFMSPLSVPVSVFNDTQNYRNIETIINGANNKLYLVVGSPLTVSNNFTLIIRGTFPIKENVARESMVSNVLYFN